MIHLWVSAKKIKCGDEGYLPPKGIKDPLDASDDEEKEKDKSTSAK